MNKLRKRLFAGSLAVAVATTSFNIGSIAVQASTSPRGRVIVAFEELPEEIAEQTLPIGGKKSDLIFPETLEILLYTENTEDDTKSVEKEDKDKTGDEEIDGTGDLDDENTDETGENGSGTEDGNDESSSGETGSGDEGGNDATGEDNGGDDTSGNAGDNEGSESGSTGDNGASDSTGDTGSGGGSDESVSNESGSNGTNTENTGSSPENTDTGKAIYNKEETHNDFTGTDGFLAGISATLRQGAGSLFAPVKVYAAELGDENDADNGGDGSGSGGEGNGGGENPDGNSEEGTQTGDGAGSSEDGNTGDGTTNIDGENGDGSDENGGESTDDPDGTIEDGTPDENTEVTDDDTENADSIKKLADGEPKTLEGVRWLLDRDRSEYGSKFQAVREGDVFYFVPDIDDFGLTTEAELPTIKVTIGEEESPAFDQFMIVSGVKVSVTAPEGVFPKDAALKVKKIDDERSNEKVSEAVMEDMGLSDEESLQFLTFDITILDEEGKELQPNTKYGKAIVTFSQADLISDYIDAPGEETDGKLGDGASKDGESGITVDATDGEKTIGGDEEEAVGKKTLRVYHFEDDMDDPEILESELNEGEKAVSVETEHFSLYTLAAASVTSKESKGDFDFEYSGATFNFREDTENHAVVVEITPTASSENINVNVTMASDKEETDWGLYFSSTESDANICVTLDGVKIKKNNRSKNENGLKLKDGEYELHLKNAELSVGTISDNITSNEKESGAGAALLAERSNLTIVLEEGISNIGYNTCYAGYFAENLKIEAAKGANSRDCILNVNYSGSADLLYTAGCFVGSGTLEITGGTIKSPKGPLLHKMKSATFSGGFVTMGYEAFTKDDLAPLMITGGTHIIERTQSGTQNYRDMEKNISITGGSVAIYGASDEQPVYKAGKNYAYECSVIDFSSAYGNTKIEGIYVGTGTGSADVKDKIAEDYTSYGVTDCYTDENGKAYLWVPQGDYYIYGVRMETGTFVHTNGAFNRAKKGDDTVNKFVPYNPIDMDSMELNTADLELRNDLWNKLHDFLTVQDSKGNALTAKNDGLRFTDEDGVSNNLYDIEWTVARESSTGDLTDYVEVKGGAISNYYNYSRSTRITSCSILLLKKRGVYTLTATVYDRINGPRSKTFTLVAVEPVTDIKLNKSQGNEQWDEASEIELLAGKEYTFTPSGSKVTLSNDTDLPYRFDIDPSDATYTDIVWSWAATQKSAGVQLKDGSDGKTTLTAKNAGTYSGALIATITNGKGEEDFVKAFNVVVKSTELTDKMVTLDPEFYEYTGSAISPTVVVKDGNNVLTEGEDYEITGYKNNVNIATASDKNPPTVIVEGKGKYIGTVSKTFTITPVSLKDATVTLDKDVYPYTGGEIKPKVTVVVNGKTLTEGKDYEITYKNNVQKAKASDTNAPTVIVEGIGNYKDSSEGKTFGIAELPTGVITIVNERFTDLQTKDKTVAYIGSTATATITAEKSSGSSSNPTIEYVVSEKFYGSESEIKAAFTDASAWKTYSNTNKPTTIGDKNNYIYVRLTEGTGDNAVTTYLSTQNIVDDRTAPDVSISSAAIVGSTGTVKVSATDKLSGVANYYVLAVKDGESAPTKEDVKAKGTKSTSTTVRVQNVSTSEKYIFYAVAEDKVGNLSEVVNKEGTIGSGKITGKISILGHTYEKLQTKQTVDDYTNAQKEITISGSAENGVAKIEYFITDKFYSSKSAIEGAATETKGSGSSEKTFSNWAEYDSSSKPYLLRNQINYIYAKITDNGGGTTYVSSNGIWEDEIVPTTSNLTATSKDTTSTVTVKGTDSESGVARYYLIARPETAAAPANAEEVKNSGLKSATGSFNLTGLTAGTKYKLYAVTEDKAGNLSEIKTVNTTTKADASASASPAKSAASTAKGGASGAGASAASPTSGKSSVDERIAQAAATPTKSPDSEGIRDGVPYIEDATEGILIGRAETSGWDRIQTQIRGAVAPAEIFVDMNGSTVVPKEAFDEFDDRDITCYFVMNDEVTWAVNGLSFTSAPQDIDFRVRTGTKNIPTRLLNEVADVYPHTELSLSHDGDFGFTAILSLSMGDTNEGLYANLYYYNEEENGLEFNEANEIDGGGRANFEFHHASDYTVILRGDALTEKTATAITDGGDLTYTAGTGTSSDTVVRLNRNTGRIWLILVSILSFILCGFILFMPDKDRKKQRSYA